MRVRARLIALGGNAALALATIGGCALTPAGHQPATDGGDQTAARQAPAWAAGSSAYARLLRLEGSQRRAATTAGPSAIRGLDTAALAVIGPDDPGFARAQLGLDEALAALARQPAGAQEPPPAPTEGALLRAQRFYVAGIAKLADGDPAAAARDLSAAAQLDPSSPSPWLRLAEAQARMGQAGASLLSRRRAVELGSDDTLSLAALGLQGARTGQHELAAHYLARCLSTDARRADPLLRPIALVRIADPLAQLGYLRASIEALEEGLELPRQLRAPTRFADEAADIARRVSDLWVQIGDTACRLGDDARAVEAYETAAAAPSVDPAAILTRRAYVLLRAGRVASVARLVLDDIASRDGRADERDLSLLAILREDGRVGPLVRDALDDLASSLDNARTPTERAMLALARAAVRPTEPALALLGDRVEESPGDAHLIEALFARCPDAGAVEARALAQVERSPASAAVVAEALLPWHPSPGPLCEGLPDTPAGRLLRAHLLLALDRPAVALEDDASGVPVGTRALVAAEAGAWDELDRLLAALGDEPLSRARALRAAHRFDAGLRALAPLAEAEDAPVGVLVLAAELAANSGDSDRALTLLARAREADPYDERVYEGLLNVQQALGDQQAVAGTIRELRARVPSSNLLRWVSAQEEARRGLLDQAERTARELAEGAADNGNAMRLLLSIWGQRRAVDDLASLNSAEAWLADLTTSAPVTGPMLTAHAGLLALLDRTDEAEAVLRGAVSDRPTPETMQALETLLRSTDRDVEADRVAEARLAAWGRGIAASVSRAEHHAQRAEWTRATDALIESMPQGVPIGAQHQRRAVLIAGALATALQSGDGAELDGPTLRLLTVLDARGVELPWQLSYTRWALLSNEPDVPVDEIVRAGRSLLAAVQSREVADALIGERAGELGVPVGTLEEARSQIAYQLAGMLYALGREEASLAVYEIALEHNPDHAWALNDLGYFLAERHERLDDAARMLERAYELKPGQANIADSLGWLRYKLGQFTDEQRPDGSVREGAVSLLIAATGLPGGESNATVHDHLGDAFWRSGDRERAEASWVRAQQILVGQLARLRDGGDSPQRERLTEEAGAVGAKLDALAADREPQVAPLIDR